MAIARDFIQRRGNEIKSLVQIISPNDALGTKQVATVFAFLYSLQFGIYEHRGDVTCQFCLILLCYLKDVLPEALSLAWSWYFNH